VGSGLLTALGPADARCLIPTAGGAWPSSRVRLSPRSARYEWLGRAYGRDDIVNGGAGCGGVGFIVDERFVRGGLGDTVAASKTGTAGSENSLKLRSA
jgi:hypothetical protein